MTELRLGGSDLVRLIVAVAAAFIVPVLAWYLWYLTAGYTPLTVTVAQIAGLIARAAGALVGPLGLNLTPWLVSGAVYLFSGNLWLVVIAHAATDYGMTPLITGEPAFGLVFMAMLIAGAWRTGRRRATKDTGAAPG